MPNRSLNGKKSFYYKVYSDLIVMNVVLTNTSRRAIKIWSQECMWGFTCLSFDLRGNGEVRHITRQQQDWDMNAPIAFEMQPGEHYVIHVDFADHSWPVDWIPVGAGTFTIRPVFEIRKATDTLGAKVDDVIWKGKATGKFEEFSIR